MNIDFTPAAWDEYVDWLQKDRKTLKRINLLMTGTGLSIRCLKTDAGLSSAKGTMGMGEANSLHKMAHVSAPIISKG